MRQIFITVILKFAGIKGKICGHLFALIDSQGKRWIAGHAIKAINIAPRICRPYLIRFFYELIKNMTRRNSLFVEKPIGNLKISLDISQKTQRLIFLYPKYEEPIRTYIGENLNEGDIFIDIGANIGYYALIGSIYVGKAGQVFAFEPEDNNFRALENNIIMNHINNVNTIKKAVGSKVGNSTLYLNPLNEGGHSLNSFTNYHDSGDIWSLDKVKMIFPGAALEQTVETITLDSFAKEISLMGARIIKIDVEGFEEAVIQGMENYINDFFPEIICEISCADSSIPRRLEEKGYSRYMFNGSGLVVQDNDDIVAGNNYLFKKK